MKLIEDIFMDSEVGKVPDSQAVALLTISPRDNQWVGYEIRKSLYETSIMSGCRMLSAVEWVQVFGDGMVGHKLEILSGIADWYSKHEKQYKKVIAYFPATSEAIKEIKRFGLPCDLIPAQEYPSPGWMEVTSRNDCLADPRNLQMLQMYTRRAILAKYLTKQVGMTRKDPPGRAKKDVENWDNK